jgi:hypothetical protein
LILHNLFFLKIDYEYLTKFIVSEEVYCKKNT